jgi:two-component system chemotaxis response regulator CheY
MSRTCLVVDDSRVVRKVARRILEANGFAVEEAEDGQKALEACHRRLPDCVLLDWNMPVMDGLEFLKAVRSEFGADNPPVVFCTTETDMDFIEKAIESGAQEYVVKPLAQVGLL